MLNFQLADKVTGEIQNLTVVDDKIRELFGVKAGQDGDDYFYQWFDAIGFNIARENDVVRGVEWSVMWYGQVYFNNIRATTEEKLEAIKSHTVLSKIGKFLIDNYTANGWNSRG